MADAATRPSKPAITPGAWQEARGLIYAHRKRLSLGLVLLLVNRIAGFVLPASPKWVIDRVIGQHRDRKSTRLNSSHDQISYAVFCLKKKTIRISGEVIRRDFHVHLT